MAKIGSKRMVMVGNGWKWMELTGDGWKWPKCLKMAGIGSEEFEIKSRSLNNELCIERPCKMQSIIKSAPTRGGRQKGSSPLASYCSGSKATNLLRRLSPYDGAFKCVQRESEDALGRSPVEPIQLLLLLDGHI